MSAEELRRTPLLELLRGLIEPLLEGLARERPERWALCFARAQREQNEAFETIYERIGGRLITLLSTSIERLGTLQSILRRSIEASLGGP